MLARARSFLPNGPADLLRQIVLFCGAYWLYRVARGLVDTRAAEAFDNARAVIDVERGLGLFFEPAVHAWASGNELMIDAASWMYLNSHFAVTTRHAGLDLPAPQRALLLRPQHVHGRHGHRADRLRGAADRAAALHARVGVQRLGGRVHRREGRLRVGRAALQPVRGDPLDARGVRADAGGGMARIARRRWAQALWLPTRRSSRSWWSRPPTTGGSTASSAPSWRWSRPSARTVCSPARGLEVWAWNPALP